MMEVEVSLGSTPAVINDEMKYYPPLAKCNKTDAHVAYQEACLDITSFRGQEAKVHYIQQQAAEYLSWHEVST